MTLVEVLVVMVMITIMTALAVGTVRFGTRADNEIDRLALVLDQAGERARVRGTPLRFEVMPHGYRFTALDTSGVWQVVTGDAALAERSLPVDMSLERVRRDGKEIHDGLVFGSDVVLFSIDGRSSSGPFSVSGQASGSVVREQPTELTQ